MPLRPALNRSLVALATAVIAGVLTVASPVAAHAHSGLVASDPADGATVPASVDRVTLTFTELPLAGLDAGLVIRVTGPSGAEATRGDVTTDGSSMSRAVTLDPAGRYELAWRYVSPDGHPIDGSSTFTVSAAPSSSTPGAATSTPTPTPTTASAAPAGTPTESIDDAAGASPVPWIVAVGALAVAVAALVIALVVRRRDRS